MYTVFRNNIAICTVSRLVRALAIAKDAENEKMLVTIKDQNDKLIYRTGHT